MARAPAAASVGGLDGMGTTAVAAMQAGRAGRAGTRAPTGCPTTLQMPPWPAPASSSATFPQTTRDSPRSTWRSGSSVTDKFWVSAPTSPGPSPVRSESALTVPHHSLKGMSILKGFGFIQFAEESSAETAIREAQHTDILGHRVGELSSDGCWLPAELNVCHRPTLQM